MDSQIKIGTEIIILKDNMILLGKRKNCYGAGSWGLPGGHLEIGEKMVDAAKRELKEELDINTPQLTLKTIVDDTRGDQHYLHISFILENFDGNFKLMEPDKCEAWNFFPIDALPENIFVGHLRILETFKKDTLYLY